MALASLALMATVVTPLVLVASARPASAGFVTNTVNVGILGGDPQAVAVDETANKVYVANPGVSIQVVSRGA